MIDHDNGINLNSTQTSHEEKLRAIRDVEMKKNAVIEVREGRIRDGEGGGTGE